MIGKMLNEYQQLDTSWYPLTFWNGLGDSGIYSLLFGEDKHRSEWNPENTQSRDWSSVWHSLVNEVEPDPLLLYEDLGGVLPETVEEREALRKKLE